MLAEYELKYTRACEAAQSAFLACKVKNNADVAPVTMQEVLVQRQRVLRYAVEDSRANVALLELKRAEAQSKGEGRGEGRTDRRALDLELAEARGKMQRAQNALSMLGNLHESS